MLADLPDTALRAALVVVGALLLLPIVTRLDRWTRPGAGGLLRLSGFSLASTLKLLEKRAAAPQGADQLLHLAAPVLELLPVVALLALLPMGRVADGAGLADDAASLSVALAMPLLSTAAVALCGFAGNNRLALLGALRLAILRLSVVVVLAVAALGVARRGGTLSLADLVTAQAAPLAGGLPSWGVLLAPLGFLAAVCALAVQSQQLTASSAVADDDLVDPYAAEATGPVLLGHQLFEALELVVLCGLLATLFLGGPAVPDVDVSSTALGPLVGALAVVVKALLLTAVVFGVRRALPPLDHGRAVRLCWTVLIPTAAVGLLLVDVAALLGAG